MIKSFEDFQSFGKDGFEAYVASATAMTKGFQAIAAGSRRILAQVVREDTRKLSRRRSPPSRSTRSSSFSRPMPRKPMRSFLGEMNKIGELYVAAAKEAYKPFESKLAGISASSAK